MQLITKIVLSCTKKLPPVAPMSAMTANVARRDMAGDLIESGVNSVANADTTYNTDLANRLARTRPAKAVQGDMGYGKRGKGEKGGTQKERKEII